MIVVVVAMVTTMTSEGRLEVNHGNISMYTEDVTCDDGKRNIMVDLPPDDSAYECTSEDVFGDLTENSDEVGGRVSCLELHEVPDPIHTCMDRTITYTDDPPRGGPHRPKWPTYGTYTYLPPQRWVHSLEHGAVAFLYHPCSDKTLRDQVANRLKSCMRKFVITPYRLPHPNFPFALLTYSCKYEFNNYDEVAIVGFIRKHAMDPKKASEYDLPNDGSYDLLLEEKSQIVPGSDFKDSNLCPDFR
ncbi:hypothetical protein HELRODRAFT_155212 [Helobdella robusta]|uniref:DUF3105 domain-containing protein n=1 Tax=Helobdella robusta TaxID=6412 RepID=T1ELH6_HELRO|nr:hypothetical protein HELRODRAFT_155212 [Helobdella robusta]ESN95090.1 hypothetical protein HELRODRAFT_155212 [Helobdella robusta]